MNPARARGGTLLDPVRRIARADTPEERVRIALLRHLLDVVGVPAACLEVEWSLRRFDPAVRGRVDVAALTGGSFQGGALPVLLCECKAPEIAIDEAVFAQMRRYLRLLPTRWALLTNGLDTQVFRRDADSWARVPALPPWAELRQTG